jgi:hypothetical protein
MQVEQGKEQSRQIEVEESNAYSLFMFAVRSQITREYYLRRLRRLRVFINYISLLPRGTMKERCKSICIKRKKGSNWVFSCIVRFLQYQKERVEREEITQATLRNFVKAIKLFYEMSDILFHGKRSAVDCHKLGGMPRQT